MTKLDADHFKYGDIAQVRWRDTVSNVRVLSYADSGYFAFWTRTFEARQNAGIDGSRRIVPPFDESKRYAVRVAINAPFDHRSKWNERRFPVGMPVVFTFFAGGAQLGKRDPDWNPFEIRPYATGDVYRKAGVYLGGTFYEPGDRVWVWENIEWHPAEVVSVARWISVRYLDGFSDAKGNSSKSYRTWQVCPVIGEHSATFEKYMKDRA